MLVVYSTLRGIDVSLGKASMVHTSGGIDYGVALRCHLCGIPTLLSSGDHHLVWYTSPYGCGHTDVMSYGGYPSRAWLAPQSTSELGNRCASTLCVSACGPKYT